MVLTAPEVQAAVLARLDGPHWVMASLLYGSGVFNRGGKGVRSPLNGF